MCIFLLINSVNKNSFFIDQVHVPVTRYIFIRCLVHKEVKCKK